MSYSYVSIENLFSTFGSIHCRNGVEKLSTLCVTISLPILLSNGTASEN
jgi:hypothetical protein